MPIEFLTDILKGKENSAGKALSIKPEYRTITWTYRELSIFSDSVSSLLQSKGVAKGDRVILWASNSPYWVGVFFGCVKAGIVVVPLHTENNDEFVQKVTGQTEPKMFFKSSDVETGLKYNWVNIEYLDEEFQNTAAGFPAVGINSNNIAEILYTSGTTGDPKGVILTHKNLVSSLASVKDIINIRANDSALAILPLSHIFEQIVEFRILWAGARIVYVPALSASIVKKTLAEYGITKMASVPEFLKRVVSSIEAKAEKEGGQKILSALFKVSERIKSKWFRRVIFTSVRSRVGGKLSLVVSGGAPLDAPTAKKWELMGVDIIQGYGMTETSAIVSVLPPGEGHIESVGKVVPGAEVKIAEDKEILVKGGGVTQGYWKNEEKTAEMFTDDGWLKTGDLGEVDKDGYLCVRGRKKFMILTPSGQNVYPEDIEAELNREPGVKDSAVVGLPKGKDIEIHAVLPADTGDIEKIISKANSRLAGFQKIQSWSVWPFEDFPRSTTLKIKRHEVLAYLEGKRESRESGAEESSARKASSLTKIISRVLGKPASAVKNEAKIVSLGLDSLSKIELVSVIEEEMGTEIEEAMIGEETTVADLEKMVKERPAVVREYKLVSWPRFFFTRIIRELLYFFIILPISKIFAEVQTEGIENLKGLDYPVVFMPNHVSRIDGAAVYIALPSEARTNIAMAAATDVLFEQFAYLQPFAALLFNVYPFPRYSSPKAGLEYTGALLDQGWNILYFPEGIIAEKGEEIKLKRGAGVVAVGMQSPIVPVKIEGTEYIMPKGTHFPRKRGRVKIRFGKPIKFSKSIPYGEAASRIEDAIRKL